MKHAITLELPAPVRTPLEAGAVVEPLSKAQRALVVEHLGDAPVYLALRAGTRIDTGSWVWRPRVRVFALDAALMLLAAGRRPRAERIPFTDLRESVYNAVTGEVVLAPAHHVRVRRLRMSPLDGYQLLAQIYCKEPGNARASG